MATIKAAREEARAYFGNGLYAAVGNEIGPRRGPRSLLYFGVGDPLHQRLLPQHHVLGRVDLAIQSIWLGEIATAGLPGRRAKRIEPALDIAEWASTFFLNPVCNVRKKTSPPSSGVIVNRWWLPDDETPTERPAAKWADIVEWDNFRGTANLCWFGKRARVKNLNYDLLRVWAAPPVKVWR